MKRKVQTVVGLIFGLGCLWLLFRDTNWAEVGRAIREMNGWWFLAAQVPLWASFFFRVKRWTYIVRATAPASFSQLFAATQIGFLANFTLPARLGEVIRALVLTRLTTIRFSKSLALVALDRVTDLVGLMGLIIVAVIAFQPEGIVTIPAEVFGGAQPIKFPASQYRAGAWGVGFLMVGVLAAFVVLYISKRFVMRVCDAVVGVVSKKFAEKLRGMIELFAEGMHIFRSPGDMAKSLFFSLLVWTCAVFLAVFMLEAFNIDAPWYTAFVMQALLAVFIAAPGAPGLVGQFHAPIVICLVMVLPGIDVNLAKAFAIVTHLVNFPPLIVLAAYGFLAEDLRLAELGKAGARLADSTTEPDLAEEGQ